MKRVIYSALVVLMLCVVFPVAAFADTITGQFIGVSRYACSVADRVGAQCVTNLDHALYYGLNKLGYSYTKSNMANNSLATQARFYEYASSDKTLFAYAGHGHSLASYNAFHPYHDSNTSCIANYASQQHTAFKSRYIVAYTCNQLTNDGLQSKLNNIFRTFKGARVYCGYASSMYLDSREGTRFGNNLVNGDSVVDAFNEAARYYQARRSTGDTIPRAMGYNSAKDDKITSNQGAAPSWTTSNSSSFSIFTTIVIPHK